LTVEDEGVIAVPTWVDGQLVGFDLESTGVNPHTAMPVSWALVYFDHGEEVERHTGLIDPEVPIPPEASAIHGITDEDVAGWTTWDVMATALAITLCSADMPIVGMNLAYDLTLLRGLVRLTCDDADRYWPFDRLTVVDLAVIDKAVDTYRKGHRTLSDLCTHYGVQHGGAHDATEDVVATVKCFLELARRRPMLGLRPVAEIHQRQAVWRHEQLRSLSAYRVKQGQSALPPESFGWPLLNSPVLEVAATA
jgi:DNA polymerase-3 subunit epsilon